jgi:hypothetical protein
MSNEQLEFKLGEDESPATVTVDEQGQAQVVEEDSSQPAVKHQTTSEDLDQHSDKVKRRIDKLTARLRETERREQAAIEYAKQVQLQAAQAQQQIQSLDLDRLNQAKSRVDSQAIALKQIIKKARDEGDIDTETEAQERLTGLLIEQQRISDAEQQRQWAAQQAQVQAQQVSAQPQPQPQPQRIDPKAEQWASDNPWYGRDTAMTHAAWGIHRQLIEVERFDAESDEYYDELNRRIRDTFPHKFQGANRPSRNVQTVAPASRSSGVNHTARRTVRLTPSQVAIAKKLNVPLEEYAKYVKE